jgi:hypothetical protein
MNTMHFIASPLRFVAVALLSAALLAACGRESEAPPASTAAGKPEPWALPALPGSAQHDLSVAPDGRLLLSWINTQPGRRPAFQFAEFYPDGTWEGPRTIAVGNSMFVNWADTPHIAATADRALWAHWLQKTADAPYAYDVVLVRSLDHGMNWSAPRRVHDDATATEHGFVAFWPQGESALGVAWLDGRNTSGHQNHSTHGGETQAHEDDRPSGDAMTLRAAVFDAGLGASGAAELDARVCDCCQTDAAAVGAGALLVYRDRSEDDIRDIYAVRFDGKAWSKPQPVHADGWKMPACPVNGPSVAAAGDNAVVGWYTAAGDTPSLKLARSADGGAGFAAPVEVDRGPAVLGRVAVALDEKQAWVLWLREDAGVQSLWLARYAPDLSKPLQRIELAKLQGKGRATGFPKIALRDGAAYAVWSDAIDGEMRLQGARIAGSR